jgi:hypothetical protein
MVVGGGVAVVTLFDVVVGALMMVVDGGATALILVGVIVGKSKVAPPLLGATGGVGATTTTGLGTNTVGAATTAVGDGAMGESGICIVGNRSSAAILGHSPTASAIISIITPLLVLFATTPRQLFRLRDDTFIVLYINADVFLCYSSALCWLLLWFVCVTQRIR